MVRKRAVGDSTKQLREEQGDDDGGKQCGYEQIDKNAIPRPKSAPSRGAELVDFGVFCVTVPETVAPFATLSLFWLVYSMSPFTVAPDNSLTFVPAATTSPCTTSS